ncbi:MAG: carboxypeptidase-like regulatory domain-containing protein [Flavobacterium sp.]
MKRILLIFICLFSLNAYCQTIKGTVFDENKMPIVGASVYLDGTTIATLTNEKGMFFLNVNNKINTSMVIRFMGYETVAIGNPFENNNGEIYLVPKQVVLNEVVIKKDYFTREQKLQLFRAQFLGTTKAGKSCKINNEEDINFEYDYKTNTLFATSNNPLKIENPYLGYQIEFDLYEFKVRFYKKSIKSSDVTKSLFLGTTLYSEVKKEGKIKKIRDNVYNGSSMHFFKNLSEKRWNKDCFLLYKGRFQDIPDHYFAISNEGNLKKVVLLSNDINDVLLIGSKPKFYVAFNLLYKKKKQSQVVFLTNAFYVDEYGNNSDSDKIEFGGDLATRKLGDMLPMNYIP